MNLNHRNQDSQLASFSFSKVQDNQFSSLTLLTAITPFLGTLNLLLDLRNDVFQIFNYQCRKLLHLSTHLSNPEARFEGRLLRG